MCLNCPTSIWIVFWGSVDPVEFLKTVSFDKDVKVAGQSLPAGKYGFFIIPNEYQSTFVFNKVADQWGAFNYDAEQDQLRVNVYAGQGSNFEERLVYEVNEDGFEVRWEYGKASAKIQPAM